MKTWHRIVFAVLLLLIDSAVFFLPLTALVTTFAILFRPRWFLRVVKKVYGE